MQPITPEAKQYLQERIPQFVRAVNQVRTQSRLKKEPASMHMSLLEFNEDALLLYAAMWYAGSCGVSVLLEPVPKDNAVR